MAATTHSPTHALVAPRDGNHVFATKPTALTRFLRTFLLWQIVRFIVINLKMVRIIFKSHKTHLQRHEPRALPAKQG